MLVFQMLLMYCLYRWVKEEVKMSSDSEVELDDAAAPEDDDTESDFSEAEASITEEESEGSDFGDEENENPKKVRAMP